MAGRGAAGREQDGRTPFAPRCVNDLVEERLFAYRRDLLTRLDLVFMDTTSLYFEGAGAARTGALLAAFLFEATGAMAFPKAATTRPLSLTPESRLMAKLMASMLSAAGIVSLVAGWSASPSSGPELAPPDPAAGAPVA